jgi:hypothetical protein
MVEAARGEGRIGRAGLVSLSYARTMANGSGTATPPWARTGPLPGLYLRILALLAGADAMRQTPGFVSGDQLQSGRSSC